MTAYRVSRRVKRRVYVGNLPHYVCQRDLELFLKGYGRTRDISIKNGYAFVEFQSIHDAVNAIHVLNGKKLFGEKVIVEAARDYYGSSRFYGKPLRTKFRVVVKNVSSRVDWRELKDYIRRVSNVKYVDVHHQHLNEGIVEFASLSDMKNAIEKLDYTKLSGRRIEIIEDHRGGENFGYCSRYSKLRSRSESSVSNSSTSVEYESRLKSRNHHSRSESKHRLRSNSCLSNRCQSNYTGKNSRSRSRSRSKHHSRSKSKSRSSSPSPSQSNSSASNRSKLVDKESQSNHSKRNFRNSSISLISISSESKSGSCSVNSFVEVFSTDRV